MLVVIIMIACSLSLSGITLAAKQDMIAVKDKAQEAVEERKRRGRDAMKRKERKRRRRDDKNEKKERMMRC